MIEVQIMYNIKQHIIIKNYIDKYKLQYEIDFECYFKPNYVIYEFIDETHEEIIKLLLL